MDRYPNYRELARHESLGSDFWPERRRRASRVLVLAPHGGRIERGTAEIARAIAGREFSYYAFLGISPSHNQRLHLTSHHFDEPRALRLTAGHEIVLAVHGCGSGGGQEHVYLGGLDHGLRDELARALAAAGFQATSAGHAWRGEDPANICNRGARGAGVQLELTQELRDSERLPLFVDTVRRVLLERDGKREDEMRGRTGWQGVRVLALLGLLGVPGCQGLPTGAQVVQGFEAARYLGVWHEIARLDHRFERGLSHVTAEYIGDGERIRVVNRGYDARAGRWKQAVGRALPVGDPSQGRLKVSFFGPFYGAYNILELDPDYRLALVSGPGTQWLWILAREPQVPRAELEPLLEKARGLGFPVEQLIWVEQGEPRP
ncbi:MAG: poly-gamma-glutamate hydrolase family protein [Candidatus Delongbacteria bacterium]